MKQPKKIFAWTLSLFLVGASALFLASCDSSQTTQVSTSPTPIATPPGEGIIATPDPNVATAPDKTKVTIYEVGTNAEGEGQLQPVETDIDLSNPTAAVLALNRMTAVENSPLPKGSRALSVRFDADLATADFSKEFETNFSGGDRMESLMFNAILATLGQFPNVKRVQILVEGKKVSLGGTQDTENPLNVPSDLVATAQK